MRAETRNGGTLRVKHFDRTWRRTWSAGAALLLLCLWSSPPQAGTTGTLAGNVHDPKDQPLDYATISVVGERLAYSDAEGRFHIINIPPGEYTVKVSRIGYDTKSIEEVVISADQTTRLDVELGDAPIVVEEVQVKAERLPVDLNITSTRFSLRSREIEELPVQELEDVVNLQAGVVDGHFRGGRAGEVQYQVDGVSVNNPFDNTSSLKIDRSLLQEVQVISGTFDAEYGQAMSGVVNAVLKDGTDEFEWSAEAYGGGFVFPGRADERLISDDVRPAAVQNFQLTMTGPAPAGNTVYLLSGRRYVSDGFTLAERVFMPTDSADFENRRFFPTGDGEEIPLGYTREWSGFLKLTNNSIRNAELSYQAVVNRIKGQRSDFNFRLNPEGLSTQRTLAVSHGLDWTHTLSQSSFLDFSVRQNYRGYKDYVYEDVYDPRYDAAGPPDGDPNYELGAYVQGVSFDRFEQTTNSLVAKSSLVSQIHPEHQLKVGGEVHVPRVEFGTPGHLTYTVVEGRQQLVRHVDEPPDYPGVQTYYPLFAAAFAQDQIDWPDLTVRVGARFDYFDTRATVPGDPANPANTIDGAPTAPPEETTPKVSLSPRLGVAIPVMDRAAVHFAYGHFRQFPALGDLFANANYEILENLQASGISYGVMGNPDVKPEKTVQYEIGYKHALTNDLGLDVTVFYKDIRDLLGVEFITTYNDAEYARFTNVDFGNVLGVTIAVDHRRFGPLTVALDYTWQRAKGNSSDPRETAIRAEAGEDPRPRLIPLDWDQRHTLNLTVSLVEPGAYAASAILRVASGQPYTPIIESGFGHGLDQNSGRKPSSAIIDLRAERQLGIQWGADTRLFARVFNLFDTRFFNGPVFNSTGSPYYSRFTEANRVALADPTRYYPPRRVEVGLSLSSP
ncbi:MAG: TonB-dependent receptor [Candidatus Eisenbacteria bacterium]|nr:TonB-dependent receptor [Candidatus Eisenbacteria bacterium]